MTTLDRMNQLINTARQDNKTPAHFRAAPSFLRRFDDDVKRIPSAAAQTRERYRGIPIVEDSTVNGVALVVEEDALRVEV